MKKQKHKLFKILLGFVISFLIIQIIFIFGFLLWYQNTWMYNEITYPAYLSVASTCNFNTFNEGELFLNKKGYFTVGYYTSSTDKITMIIDNPETLRHEEIHRQQKINKR